MNTFDGMTGVHRARTALQLGRPQEAVRLAQEVLAANPHDAEAMLVAAQAHAQLDEPELQLQAAMTALQERPGSYEGRILAGVALHTVGRRDESAQMFRDAIALDPRQWQGHSFLGWALSEDRRHREEAWNSALHAVELEPAEATTHALFGQVAAARKDWATAEQAFRRALELDPQDAEAMNGLSVTLAATGRRREAAHGFGATLAIDPQLDEVRGSLDHLLAITIQRLHWLLWAGLFICSKALANLEPGPGRMVAVVTASVAVAAAVWFVWRDRHGLPPGVARYAWSFPRRAPLQALWGLCDVVAFLGLVGVALVPGDLVTVPLGLGLLALLVGCIVSWISFFGRKAREGARRS